jgi:hypothetical protein
MVVEGQNNFRMAAAFRLPITLFHVSLDVKARENDMKRSMILAARGLYPFLFANCALAAAAVPDSFSSEGPALATFNNRLVLAWAAEPGVAVHTVWYATIDGGQPSQAQIPGATTTSAPSLGATDQQLYLATTPPGANERIYYYASNGTGFESNGVPLCDAQKCAETLASPALLGDGSTLYAAWTTPAGTIMYATRLNDVWKVAPLPIPNAVTTPSTGPTLALYQNRLYAAWVDPNGKAVSVSSATLPLSSSSWTAQPVRVAASTTVAPALGIFTVDETVPNIQAGPNTEIVSTKELFLAWTRPDSTISFARMDGPGGSWLPTASPVPLPSGPVTTDAPALSSSIVVLTDEVCLDSSAVGSTSSPGQNPGVNKLQRLHPCPGVVFKGP